jgi:hypothetical protein
LPAETLIVERHSANYRISMLPTRTDHSVCNEQTSPHADGCMTLAAQSPMLAVGARFAYVLSLSAAILESDAQSVSPGTDPVLQYVRDTLLGEPLRHGQRAGAPLVRRPIGLSGATTPACQRITVQQHPKASQGVDLQLARGLNGLAVNTVVDD